MIASDGALVPHRLLAIALHAHALAGLLTRKHDRHRVGVFQWPVRFVVWVKRPEVCMSSEILYLLAILRRRQMGRWIVIVIA